jgi:glycine betaine/proline transport system substrate-binding protein
MNMLRTWLVEAGMIGVAAALAFASPRAEAASVPESGDPIVLSKLDWTGQYVTTEVAAAILRRMGYKVEILQTTQVPMVDALANGQISASVENWYQAVAKLYDENTASGRIESLGNTGLVGQEGWYYPAYVEKRCPGLPDWRALKKCADIFATADTAPKGRLLDYPAEWHPDAKKWVQALALNLVAAPSGGEGSTAAELKSAQARQEPILLQWWEPTWIATQYNLKEVKLDDSGEACSVAKAAGIDTHKSFDCPGQGIKIAKLAWPGMKEKWPAAYRLLKLFKMTNEWQAPMAEAVDTAGKKPEEVAKQWVANHEEIWKPWMQAAMAQ